MPATASADEVFRAVAEPTRRRMLELLTERERPVGDLVVVLQLSQPLVSKHLRTLRGVGLVQVRPEGRRRLYRADPSLLKAVHEWTARFERFWSDRLARIKDHAERNHHRHRADQGRSEPEEPT